MYTKLMEYEIHGIKTNIKIKNISLWLKRACITHPNITTSHALVSKIGPR